jgi:hypothetical protein
MEEQLESVNESSQHELKHERLESFISMVENTRKRCREPDCGRNGPTSDTAVIIISLISY